MYAGKIIVRELNWKKVKLLFDHPIIIVIT
jgi:hypothetical protein